MVYPASTVRFVNNLRGMNALGASRVLDSQNGNATKHTHPITSMATMLPFFHLLFAVAANVNGIKIRLIAADSKSSPKKSSSFQRLL